MKDLNDLRQLLMDNIEKLNEGKIDVKAAQAVSSQAQTILNMARLELEYIKVVRKNKSIFFDSEELESEKKLLDKQ